MDIIKQLGELAIGSRLKRLSDIIMRDGSKIYQDNSIDFEPKWFPVFYTLSEHESMSVTEIAEEIGVKHPSVSQVVKEMEKHGILISRSCSDDGRRKLLSLSNEGRDLLPKLSPVWKDISNVIHGLLEEHSENLLCAIEQFENDFDKKSFSHRVAEEKRKRQLNEVEIITFEKKYTQDFRTLNEEWIMKYFELEDEDRHILENPIDTIIKPGGHIILAKYKGEIVGTCALLKLSHEHYELVKMAVTERVRGRQIGKKLGLATLDVARKAGAKKVTLESNKSLKPAIALYQRLGFRSSSASSDTSAYERCDIKMEIDL